MTGYSALKVVDLKKVLKERGLPVSGNKADLVQRLQDADDAADAKPENEVEVEVEPKSGSPAHGDDEASDKAGSKTTETQKPEHEENGTVQTPGEADAAGAEAIESSHVPHSTDDNNAEGTVQSPAKDVSSNGMAPSSAGGVQKPDLTHELPLSDIPLPHTETTAVSEAEPESSGLGSADANGAGINKTQLEEKPPVQTPPLAAVEEARSPRGQQRKRSLTPEPDESAVRKKLKAADGKGRVTQPENPSAVGTPGRGNEQDIAASASLVGNGGQVLDQASKAPVRQDEHREKKAELSPDLRDESTFNRERALVEQARHEPTAALYVRNLKRPLQPAALRAHLSKLSGRKTEGSEILKDFWLDPIKTHCFARFASIEAASSARDGLHGQHWPDERQREALWVDYIPEEDFDKFVLRESKDKEQRRWFVDYEEIGGTVRAVLRDRSQLAIKTNDLKEARVAQEQPKELSRKPPRDDRAEGFGTLDDLFRSTAVKPILYFLPVPTERAQRHLKELARGRGGGRGRGEARYTFQVGDRLVDNGPDAGLRLDRPRVFVPAAGQHRARGGRDRR